MRTLPVTAALMFLATCLALADPTASPTPTPAPDAFPAGTDTPEGAACDFARAFIRNDANLLLATCVEPFGEPENQRAYHKFLESMAVQLRLDATRGEPSPTDLKSIGKCFAARHLLSPGAPASFGFEDVMFVDVSALLQNGDTQLCRTLVIKNRLGKWLVDPQPERTPSLSADLDEAPPSTREYSAGIAPQGKETTP